MRNELGLICDVCQNRINKGHWYLPYIPGGYGLYKEAPFSSMFEGDMHLSHLSSSDLLRAETRLQA
jgi:hypothetical protein